uniref:SFRICE_006857 n=1 Tax=Spodoptera frugiperda TaxID=7108 RepID=A0A2H1V0C4_SPOFR
MIKNKLYQYGNQNGRVPAHLNFGKEVYDNMVANKDIVALVNADNSEQKTYGEVAQLTADIAVSLTRIGIKKGDIVCICSEKNFEFLPTVLGIMCSGAVFSPTDPTYGSHPLAHRVRIVRPKVVFYSLSAFKEHKAVFDEVGSVQHYILYGDQGLDGAILFKDFLVKTVALEDFEPVPVNGWEDTAFIVYSSGTTGLPKGVPVTHIGFLLNAQNMALDSYKGLVIYTSREFYYTYGLMYALACLRSNATLVFNVRGGEVQMLEAVQKYKPTVLQLAPMIITELIKSPNLDHYDHSSVKYIVSSSTYIRQDAVLAIKTRIPSLVSVLQLYGMSEGGSICNELACTKGYKAGSSGLPGLGFIMKVVDLETRQPLGPNLRGEICIKGPSVMKAYLDNVQPDCKDEEGFLKTGDIGYYDEDGYFFVVNRIKELIKFNDVSVSPAEFEDILLQHPAVREVGVVGKPHPMHGEVPVAFIVLQSGATASEEELVEHINSRVTFRMRLAGGVRFLDRLPRGAGDKLDRLNLMKRLVDEDAN